MSKHQHVVIKNVPQTISNCSAHLQQWQQHQKNCEKLIERDEDEAEESGINTTSCH